MSREFFLALETISMSFDSEVSFRVKGISDVNYNPIQFILA